MVISLFVGLLCVAATWLIFQRITDDTFTTTLGWTISLSAVTLFAAHRHRELLTKPIRTFGFSAAGYLLVALASIPIVAAITAYVALLNRYFVVHDDTLSTGATAHPVFWAVLLIAVVPPLIEEIGFRGLVYGALRKTMTVGEAALVSSFAFAILHLSIPALLTHWPLGLYFCWLRQRSQSLWPGVFAHACHNLGCLVLFWIGLS